MTAPTEQALHPTGEYVPGHRYFVDDIVPRDGLALHFYAEESASGEQRIHWLNFRMVEMEGEEDVDPRAAVHFASGFVKWDGCCEVQLDHHMCGVRMARQVTDALLHVFVYAAESHGFEECE